jgi:uncharacterized lipoprotein YmbA
VVLLILVIGCGSVPAIRYYSLSAAEVGGAASRSAHQEEGLALGVGSFVVDPPYDQDRLVYRRGSQSNEVGFYAYDRWAAPLGRMLPVALTEGLRGTPGVASVEPAVGGREYDATLRGRLVRLEEVDSAAEQMAQIALELELLNKEGEPLWAGRLEGSASGTAGQGPEAAALMRRALEDLLRHARRQLAAALAHNR